MFGKLAYLLPLCVLIASCGAPVETGNKPAVFASILPQAYFAERIAGGDIQIEVLVGPGQSPHSFEPTPKQMAKLSRAKAFLAIGMPFEETLIAKIKASNPEMKIIDTRKNITFKNMDAKHHHDEEGHEHHADEPDPHIWLSPRLAKQIAENTCEAFVRIAPKLSPAFEKNLAVLKTDLDKLDGRLKKVLEPLRGKKIYVFHPAFGYFTESYGLEQVAVETGGKQPGAKQLANLIEKAKQDGIKVIFVQPQFSKSGAEAIAREIEGAVIPMDPLAKDYFKNLERMAGAIKRTFAGKETK